MKLYRLKVGVSFLIFIYCFLSSGFYLISPQESPEFNIDRRRPMKSKRTLNHSKDTLYFLVLSVLESKYGIHLKSQCGYPEGLACSDVFIKIHGLKLINVECGNEFSLGVNSEGQLFGWGRKVFIGLFEDGKQFEPIHIPKPRSLILYLWNINIFVI